MARYRLQCGDVARLITAAGGGYGNPLERDPALIQDDVRNDLLTIRQAKEIYGVVIDPATLAVDGEATLVLRKEMMR